MAEYQGKKVKLNKPFRLSTTESKRKKIKQYKIKASDIKLTVEKVLGIEIMTENIKF